MALKLFAQNKGFSLLEVLIGVAVLSGGITVILQAFIFCGRTTGASCDTVRGIFLAEDKMQELEFKTNNQIITEPVSQAGQYDGFRWEYRLFEEEDKAGLYKMDLEVRWGEARQGTKFGVNLVAVKKIKYPKGFTLIELLLAAAIFAVVAAGIYSAFYSGLFGYRNISEAINTYQGARLILERINRELRNSFAYSSDEPRFSGKENEMSFFTLADSYNKEGGIVKEYAFVSYGLKENKLLRLCRKNQDALSNDSGAEPEEMPADVSQLSFSYFEFNDKSFKETLRWSNAQNMPAAVKVNLVIKGERKEVEFGRTIFLP